MSKVYVDISMSLDGYVAGPDADMENPLGVGGEQLHEWVFVLQSWRETHGQEGGAINVLVAGGADMVQQALSAGLVDEVQVHIAPVLLRNDVRLFDNLGPEVKVEPVRVIESPNVTHLRYRVVRS